MSSTQNLQGLEASHLFETIDITGFNRKTRDDYNNYHDNNVRNGMANTISDNTRRVGGPPLLCNQENTIRLRDTLKGNGTLPAAREEKGIAKL